MSNEVRPAEAPNSGLRVIVGGSLGGLGGVAFGAYAGSALLLPAGLTLGFRWLLGKVIPTANKPMTSASAVHAGHGL